MRPIFLAVALFAVFMDAPVAGGGPAMQPKGGPTDLEIQQAAAAVERADGYEQIVTAVERHANALSSVRLAELVDQLLQNPDLNDSQRGVLLLERQLSLDCRQLGASAAATLLAVRVIAANAISSDTPQQFAAVLDKFAPLAGTMTVELVRRALDTPGNSWPAPLLPLMEQLARDWPSVGSLAAATRMAESANKVPAPTPAPDPDRNPISSPNPTLVGHWRSTEIVFGSPRDEHLVLVVDGAAETWIVTATSRSAVTRGRWSVKGTMLSVDWEDGRRWGQPYTFFEGQLVFPNVRNQRQFWEAIQ